MRRCDCKVKRAFESWWSHAAIGFTVGDWCRGGWIVFKKIVKKLLRGGTTSHRFVEK